MWTQQTAKVFWRKRMVVLIDEILHIPLPCVLVSCNHKLCTASNTTYIPWPPLLILPLHVLLFTETFAIANKLPKGPLIVASVLLNVASPHTKPFIKTVWVVKLKSFLFASEHLPNNLIVLLQRLRIRHCPQHPSTKLYKLNIHITQIDKQITHCNRWGKIAVSDFYAPK